MLYKSADDDRGRRRSRNASHVSLPGRGLARANSMEGREKALKPSDASASSRGLAWQAPKLPRVDGGGNERQPNGSARQQVDVAAAVTATVTSMHITPPFWPVPPCVSTLAQFSKMTSSSASSSSSSSVSALSSSSTSATMRPSIFVTPPSPSQDEVAHRAEAVQKLLRIRSRCTPEQWAEKVRRAELRRARGQPWRR